MIGSRLSAVVTMLLFAALGSRGLAQSELERLRFLEALIVAKDYSTLYDYLSQNPVLVRGDDPLSRELRGFVSECQSGALDCFGFREEQVPAASPVRAY